MKKQTILSLILLSVSLTVQSQGSVTIYPLTQKYLGNESKFNRDKFVSFHSYFEKDDPDFKKFKDDYNINPDYLGSRRFYYPISKAKNGNIPKIINKYNDDRELLQYIATAPPSALFYDKKLNYAKTDFSPYIKEISNYVADAFVKEWDQVPSYLEPFNEPMVHAPDFAKGLKGKERQDAIEAVITYICQYHKEIAKAVKSRPELEGMKIMGFGSAYPELEANNFGLWNMRFKQFIDIAGEDIDILSLHLYDGSGINNQGGRRSGSNLEAILDVLQTYSYIKHGKAMPIAITEYGRLVPNQPAWEEATGAQGNKLEKPVKTKISNYHPVTNSQAVRSQLHMVMAFMNRQNELENTVPFTIGKAPQNAMYSKSSLWVKQPDGSFEYSNRRYFFEMLKDIQGEQILVRSNNIDVQALGYADGKKIYVMLNNLNDQPQTVDLIQEEAGKLKNVSIKTLKIFEDKEPELSITKFKKAPGKITLQYGETAVITYEYIKKIKFEKSVSSNKYFSKDYLKPIEPNKEISFSFENIPNGDNVVLRLSVNREHGLPVLPTKVKVNGENINIMGDVIKGYDQKSRKEFFGTLEINIPTEFIKKENNTVSVIYDKGKGFVTTAILQIEEQK